MDYSSPGPSVQGIFQARIPEWVAISLSRGSSAHRDWTWVSCTPGEGTGYPLQYSWASLVAQLVKNLPAMWETWVRSLGWEDPWRREKLPTPVFSGFSGGSAGKEHTRNAGDLVSIPGVGRSPEEGKGYPFQYSALENSMDYTVHEVAKSGTQLSDFHSLDKKYVKWANP